MKIDEVIKMLENFKKEYGNVDLEFVSHSNVPLARNVKVVPSYKSIIGEDGEDFITEEIESYKFMLFGEETVKPGEVREFKGKYYTSEVIETSFGCENCDLSEFCNSYNCDYGCDEEENMKEIYQELGHCYEFVNKNKNVVFKKVRKPREKKIKYDITEAG